MGLRFHELLFNGPSVVHKRGIARTLLLHHGLPTSLLSTHGLGVALASLDLDVRDQRLPLHLLGADRFIVTSLGLVFDVGDECALAVAAVVYARAGGWATSL